MANEVLEIINRKKWEFSLTFLGTIETGEISSTKEQVLIQSIPLSEFILILPTKEDQEAFFQGLLQVKTLNHYNILPLKYFWKGDDEVVLCYQRTLGKLLSHEIAQSKFSLSSAIKMTIEISSALDAAHRLGIVHGHLSSDDVIIEENGRIKVFQFGLSKLLPSMFSSKKIPLHEISYFSPDFLKQKSLSYEDDIFSAGVIFYQLLTALLPFNEITEEALINAICEKNPHPLRAINLSLPSELDSLIQKVLAKEKHQRYSDFSKFIGDLKDHRFQGSLAARPEASRYTITRKAQLQGEMVSASLSTPTPEQQNSSPEETPNYRSIDIEKDYSSPYNLKKKIPEYNDFSSLYEDEKQIKTHWLGFGIVTFIVIFLICLGILKAFSLFPFSSRFPFQKIPAIPDQGKEIFIKKRIKKMLSEADAYFVKGDYATPKNNNAYDTYLKILSMDNNNIDAKYGIEQIKNTLQEEVSTALENKDFKNAEKLANSFLLIVPEDKNMKKISEQAHSLFQKKEKQTALMAKKYVKKKKIVTPLSGNLLFNPFNNDPAKIGLFSLKERKCSLFASINVFHKPPFSFQKNNFLLYGSDATGNSVISVYYPKSKKVISITKDNYDNRSPSIDPTGKIIVFASYRLAQWDIFTIPLSGGEPKQLTYDAREDDYPQFSADGKWIIYQTNVTHGWEIAKIPVNGGKPILLTHNRADDIKPILSPNGKLITYQSNANLNWDIYVMNQNGKYNHCITGLLVPETSPFFTSDSLHIVYLQGEKSPKSVMIYNISSSRTSFLKDLPRDINWVSMLN